MNRALVDQVAAAVLYEGYLLYPYRPSSLKNRQRWTFGGLVPPSWAAVQGGSEASSLRTECLVVGPHAALTIRVRCLHLVERQTRPDGQDEAREENDRPSPAPRVPSWLNVCQEAEEEQIETPEWDVTELVDRPHRQAFAFPEREQVDSDGAARRRWAVAGAVEVSAEHCGDGLFRVAVQVHNRTPMDDAAAKSRDDALMRSLVSTHAILQVRDGAFISLTDPPEAYREAAAACRNVGVWPVLVGEEGATDAMLAAPIILYDYPRIAPESPGDLFDATEIDEILTLRTLTMTDDEKKEIAGGDARRRALLERTEALAREQLMGLHGTVRGLRPLPEEKS